MKTVRYIEVAGGMHLIVEGYRTLREYEAFREAQGGEYTSACRGKTIGTVTLKRHFYRCAGCCRSFPAPAAETEPEVFRRFFDWALQGTIAGMDVFAHTFYFRAPPDENAEICCPHCAKKAKAAKRGAWYCVRADEDGITLTQSVSAAERFQLLPRAMPWGEAVLFPLKVQLRFDHGTRRTAFCVREREGTLLWAEDITEKSAPLAGFAMERNLSSHTQLRRALIRIFGKFHIEKIPFSEKDVTLETLILLNRFRGFPQNFYDAIPFEFGSKRIERSFAGMALRLANYSDTPSLYAQLGLPDKKAVRRAIFENPALLFYAEEIKSLPFQNNDVLLQILSSPEAFHFLALLRRLPGIGEYLRAVIAPNDPAAAWRRICGHIESLPFAAAVYLLLPEGKRQNVLRGRVSHGTQGFDALSKADFNYPLPREYAVQIPNSSIGEYEFRQLKNTLDYHTAGKELHNCLASCTGRRVFGIQKNRRYVGAIEIKDDAVIYTCMKDGEIESDKGAYAAFLRWVEQNGLSLEDI